TSKVFCAEFFGRRLTMHSLSWGDRRRGIGPHVARTWVLDDRIGPAYSVVAVNLSIDEDDGWADDDGVDYGGGGGGGVGGVGRRRPTHLLVTSHECTYDYRARVDGPTPDEILIGGSGGGGGGSSDGGKGGSGGNGGGGGLFAYEIPAKWKVYPRVYPSPGWRRHTIASGFRVRGLGINPGAPGFVYTFHPHRSMRGKTRPHIALAGDCSQAAYVLRPRVRDGGSDSSGSDGASGSSCLDYELAARIDCGGTVGSLAVAYGPLTGASAMEDDSVAKIFVPSYDMNKV
ncbi:unnamed protein product, partial [Phaeothamnion confervicola]